MNALSFVGIIVFGLFILASLFIVLALILSNLGGHFTKIEKGNIVYVNAGANLRNIWPNVGGHKLSKDTDAEGRQWLIAAEGKSNREKEKDRMDSFFFEVIPGTRWFQEWLLWKPFGIRFVSFFWPAVNVHVFDIMSRLRLEERKMKKAGNGNDNNTKDTAGTALKDLIVASPNPTTVSSLLYMVPRPIYMEGLELGGENAKINVLLLAVFQNVIPEIPVYLFKGEFFTLLDAALKAVVVDFLATHRVGVDADKNGVFVSNEYIPDATEWNKKTLGERPAKYVSAPLTYSHWIKLAKGENAPLEKYLRRLNASREYYNNVKKELGENSEIFQELDRLTHGEPGEPIAKESLGTVSAKELPHGLIPRFGWALVSVRMVGWEAHGDTKDLAEALLARETMFHTAEGVRQQAQGKADAIKSVAIAEASRFEILVKALVENGIDSNTAAEVVRTQLRTENIRDSDITTYVEGGASAPVLVGANSAPTASSSS